MSVSLYDTISRVILYIFKGTIDYADIVGTYNANGIYIQSHLTDECKKTGGKTIQHSTSTIQNCSFFLEENVYLTEVCCMFTAARGYYVIPITKLCTYCKSFVVLQI